MASAVQRRRSNRSQAANTAQPGPAAEPPAPATPSDAALAFCTHTDYLTRDNVRQMLPKLLQQLVSPSPVALAAIRSTPEATASAQGVHGVLAAAHFAQDAQMSHPLGYAVGREQIASLLRTLFLARSVLFPEVEILTLRSLFDQEHESAALEVKAVMRMRWLGLRVPVLAEVFCELVDRRDGHPGLCITYWSEHYSLRSLAVMLPGPLARWVDWGARRAVALAAEKVTALRGVCGQR